MIFTDQVRAVLAGYWQKEEIRWHYCATRKTQCLCWLLF